MENYKFSTHLLEDILCDASRNLEVSVMRYLINQGVSNITDALVEIMKELPKMTNKTKKKYELAIQLLIEMGAEPDLEKIRKYLPHLV